MLQLYRQTTIQTDLKSPVINRAIQRMQRDLEMTLSPAGKSGNVIYLEPASEKDIAPEQYQITAAEPDLIIRASEELGFIYALLHLSKEVLGIHPFWFWNDQQFTKRESAPVSRLPYRSAAPRVRFRGWFVNDEVLIDQWQIGGSSEKPWEMVFEALLRCHGNMVVPGTDKNAKKYSRLASEMGLWITHHHAEPLGAEMFARVYPQLEASYDKYPHLFQELWREGIKRQAGKKVIWNLGFRGQGDCPFWETDPAYQTSEARGELISRIMRIQYDMLKEEMEAPLCCTNLYGEIMELYQEGHIHVPDACISIWADNGYGKMVSRRQGNHNPRIPALPSCPGRHGIYYHASFYDLQAANHMTMLPNSAGFVRDELEDVIARGADDFWIINGSNVKPHTYFLHLIAKLWDEEAAADEAASEYLQTYFGRSGQIAEISQCYADYAKCTLPFGRYEDENAGEQFYVYTTRILYDAWMRRKTAGADELLWAADGLDLKGQFNWFQQLLEAGREGWENLYSRCKEVHTKLKLTHEYEARLFEGSIMLHTRIHRSCLNGSLHFCRAYSAFGEERLEEAFFETGQARAWFKQADEAMRSWEYGHWEGFYANDCLTDIKFTAYLLEHLMGYLRLLGDGPHYYQWQRDYLYSEEDRKVVLITNMENHLTDWELFKLILEKTESTQNSKRGVPEHNSYISMAQMELPEKLETAREHAGEGKYRNASDVISDMGAKYEL